MGVHGFISFWVFQPESWVILSIILVIIDITVGMGLFVTNWRVSTNFIWYYLCTR